MTSSTPERSDGRPSEEPPDRSTWTAPIGNSDYVPLSGSSGYPPPGTRDAPPEYPPRSRPPGEFIEYPAPTDRPEPESRSPARSHRADPDADVPPRSRGVLRHLLGLFTGLLLTPCAITLLAYGGYRYSRILPDSDFNHDTRGLVTLGAGALILLLVAASGALSPLGPFVGSLWGLIPAGLYLVSAETTVDLVADVPVVPDEAQSGALAWLALGCYLAVGATLFGTFVATATRRRR